MDNASDSDDDRYRAHYARGGLFMVVTAGSPAMLAERIAELDAALTRAGVPVADPAPTH